MAAAAAVVGCSIPTAAPAAPTTRREAGTPAGSIGPAAPPCWADDALAVVLPPPPLLCGDVISMSSEPPSAASPTLRLLASRASAVSVLLGEEARPAAVEAAEAAAPGCGGFPALFGVPTVVGGCWAADTTTAGAAAADAGVRGESEVGLGVLEAGRRFVIFGANPEKAIKSK